jgi:hypothetical protein
MDRGEQYLTVSATPSQPAYDCDNRSFKDWLARGHGEPSVALPAVNVGRLALSRRAVCRFDARHEIAAPSRNDIDQT